MIVQPPALRALRYDRLDRYAAVVGGDGERATQRQYPLAHAGQAEPELVIRPQSPAVVTDADPRTAAASMDSRRLFGRLDGDID